jgi:hypothetical protein
MVRSPPVLGIIWVVSLHNMVPAGRGCATHMDKHHACTQQYRCLVMHLKIFSNSIADSDMKGPILRKRPIPRKWRRGNDCRSEEERGRKREPRTKCTQCKCVARTIPRGWARGMCIKHAADADCKMPQRKKKCVKVSHKGAVKEANDDAEKKVKVKKVKVKKVKVTPE